MDTCCSLLDGLPLMSTTYYHGNSPTRAHTQSCAHSSLIISVVIFLCCVLFHLHPPFFEIQANCTPPFIVVFPSTSGYILPPCYQPIMCFFLSLLSHSPFGRNILCFHIFFIILPIIFKYLFIYLIISLMKHLHSINSAIKHSNLCTIFLCFPIIHLSLPSFVTFHPYIPFSPLAKTHLEVFIRDKGGTIKCNRTLIETPISLLWLLVR